jgi:hypothetical protein
LSDGVIVLGISMVAIGKEFCFGYIVFQSTKSWPQTLSNLKQ